MSIASDLQNMYENLNEALYECKEALEEKGVTIVGIPNVQFVANRIKKIKDGKNLEPLISRQIENFIATDEYIIGEYSFAYCNRLKTIDLSSVNKKIYLRSYCFYNCSSLIEFIPSSHGIYNLAGSNYVFSGCSSLTEIDLTGMEKGSLGFHVFENCTNLQKINLPEELTSTGMYPFKNCSSLNNVIIPTTCTSSIYGQHFSNCLSLDTLVLKANSLIPLVNVNAFENTPIEAGNGYIYVPSSLISSYQSATNWVTFSSQIRAIEDYPEVLGG